MKPFYSISIPKPCHENWNTMTPNEKGRFCDSCAKTVIDFTKMNTYDIQDFIHQNKDRRICGHFKQAQLDSINLRIPSQVLDNQKNFHKLFLLVLLIVMGTSLMNCTDWNGEKQKIDSIEMIDSTSSRTLDIEKFTKICDTINSSNKFSTKTIISSPKNITTDGIMAIETLGDIDIIENKPIDIDSVNVVQIDGPIQIMGDLTRLEKGEEIILGFIDVETPPEFPNTPQNLTNKEKRDYFQKEIQKMVSKNFNIETTINFGLSGKQKINVQFKIDSLGLVKEIRARAPHTIFEKEAKRVIELLPQFVPAKHNHKSVSILYSLPIIFQVED